MTEKRVLTPFPLANDWLTRAIAAAESDAAADPATRAARRNRLFALLAWARLRTADAGGALEALRLAPEPPLATLLSLTADLARLSEADKKGTGPISADELAALSAELEKRLAEQRSALSAEQQLAVDLIRCRALLAAGQAATAIKRLKPLAASQPDHAPTQRLYAAALSAGDPKLHGPAALNQWRKVQSRSRPQSPEWFAARYQVAQALAQTGEKKQAAALIRYTQALYPELGDPALQARFNQLLSRCEE